jgi:hypothetical protein
MNTTYTTQPRPQLETLACVNERCESYGQAGRHNLDSTQALRERADTVFALSLLWSRVQRAQAHGVVEYESGGGKGSERG